MMIYVWGGLIVLVRAQDVLKRYSPAYKTIELDDNSVSRWPPHILFADSSLTSFAWYLFLVLMTFRVSAFVDIVFGSCPKA